MYTAKNTASDTSNMFVLFILGCIVFFAGTFMVTGISTWGVFSTWLPLFLLVIGVMLMGPEASRTTIGVVFVGMAAMLWLHAVSLVAFPRVTMIIDWTVMGVGGVIVGYVTCRFLLIHSRRRI